MILKPDSSCCLRSGKIPIFYWVHTHISHSIISDSPALFLHGCAPPVAFALGAPPARFASFTFLGPQTRLPPLTLPDTRLPAVVPALTHTRTSRLSVGTRHLPSDRVLMLVLCSPAGLPPLASLRRASPHMSDACLSSPSSASQLLGSYRIRSVWLLAVPFRSSLHDTPVDSS